MIVECVKEIVGCFIIEIFNGLCLEIDEIKHTIIELRTGSDLLLVFKSDKNVLIQLSKI